MTDKITVAQVGTIIFERYEIQSVLDTGGLNIVYRALDTIENTPVAIKFLYPRLTNLEINREGFKKFAAIAANLTVPCFAKIIQHGTTEDKCPYLICEFIQGRSLFNILNSQGRLEIERALDIFIELTSGLDELHKCGIVHKDLKPNIVILTENNGKEITRIADYGIDKSLLKNNNEIEAFKAATENHFRISTMYLSPEQCTGTAVDTRSDIYAMGCIMYEALTGLPPFLHKDPFEIIKMHINDEPRPLRMARNDLEFPLELDLLVLKSLRKSANQRQQSMLDLKDDLVHLKEVVRAANKTALATKKHNSGAKSEFDASDWLGTLSTNFSLKIKIGIFILFGILILIASAIFANNFSNSNNHNGTSSYHKESGTELMWQDFDLQGQRAFERGDTKSAESNYLKALNLAESFGDNDRRLLITLRKLQDTYMTQSKYDDADRVESRIKEILSQQSK